MWHLTETKMEHWSFAPFSFLSDASTRPRMGWALTTVKNELKENIATLLDLQSEHIQTRKESRGAPFRDNIQKCIMQLVGELDVPTIKVSQVLQSISNWLYDKDIDKTELPSTATANNFVDVAQVLGKYQLAEELVESDRWDLHNLYMRCTLFIGRWRH